MKIFFVKNAFRTALIFATLLLLAACESQVKTPAASTGNPQFQLIEFYSPL